MAAYLVDVSTRLSDFVTPTTLILLKIRRSIHIEPRVNRVPAQHCVRQDFGVSARRDANGAVYEKMLMPALREALILFWHSIR